MNWPEAFAIVGVAWAIAWFLHHYSIEFATPTDTEEK